MKVRTFLIFVIVHLLTLVSMGQTTTNFDNKIILRDSLVTTISLEIVVFELAIPQLDTFDMFRLTTVNIKKDTIKPTFLKFQSSGTETNIKIIDSTYAKNYKNIWACPSTKRLDFGHNESGLLDISDLHTGIYFIDYTSCNIAGSYKLILK